MKIFIHVLFLVEQILTSKVMKKKKTSLIPCPKEILREEATKNAPNVKIQIVLKKKYLLQLPWQLKENCHDVFCAPKTSDFLSSNEINNVYRIPSVYDIHIPSPYSTPIQLYFQITSYSLQYSLFEILLWAYITLEKAFD